MIRAYGYADRAHSIPNTTDTQFGIAERRQGHDRARSGQPDRRRRAGPGDDSAFGPGDDMPLIGAAVTVEQLLTRSFVVGDHFDEDLDLDTSSRDTSHSS